MRTSQYPAIVEPVRTAIADSSLQHWEGKVSPSFRKRPSRREERSSPVDTTPPVTTELGQWQGMLGRRAFIRRAPRDPTVYVNVPPGIVASTIDTWQMLTRQVYQPRRGKRDLSVVDVSDFATAVITPAPPERWYVYPPTQYRQRRANRDYTAQFYISGFPPPAITLECRLAFQANAFQITYPAKNNAFQGFCRYVWIPSLDVQVAPYLEIVIEVDNQMQLLNFKPGSIIPITAKVKDPTEHPPRPFDPSLFQISITRPNGTVAVDLATLTRVDTGVYMYLYQTNVNDLSGPWTLNLKATSGPYVTYTIPQVGFVLSSV